MKGEIFSIAGHKGLIFIIYKEPLQRNEREEMGEEYEEVVYRSGAPNYLQVWKEMLKVISDQRNANSKSMRYYLIFIRLENWKTVLSAAGGGGNRDVGAAGHCLLSGVETGTSITPRNQASCSEISAPPRAHLPHC